MPSIFPIVILLHAVSLISGHGYLKTPRSRNLHAYLERDWKDGDGDSPFPEDCKLAPYACFLSLVYETIHSSYTIACILYTEKVHTV